MDVDLRQLRAFTAVLDAGTFTDAAIELGVSQAAVSRAVAALESRLGARLLRRTSRMVAPTAAGERAAAHARRVLAAVDELVTDLTTGHGVIRIGHPWSALGRHTQEFLQRWSATHEDVDATFVRTNTPTGGLAEGACDVAIVRGRHDLPDYNTVVVGHERRFCAMAADDPWASRRSVRLDEIADRTVVLDQRVGTTTLDLWAPERRPQWIPTQDIDDWLTVIAAGRGISITPEATRELYRRPGVVYRLVRDAPLVPVRAIWDPHQAHPATQEVVDLITALYRQ